MIAAPSPERQPGAGAETYGEGLARLAGVEHLPTGSPYVGTHHLQGARDCFRYAQEATRPGDIEGHLAKAAEHMLYAERAMHTAMGVWREYNARLDRLIVFLNERQDAEPANAPEGTAS